MQNKFVLRTLFLLAWGALLAVSCDKEPSDDCNGDAQILDNTCNCKVGVGHARVIDIASDDNGVSTSSRTS